MKVLVFGTTGQVARALAAQAGDMEIEAHGRETADLTDPAACAALITATDADAVINAAAYTAVDRAEEEETLARVVNGETPGILARAAADLGIPFVHISTDYVFDGSGQTPRAASDPVAPLNAYGRSKLVGEDNVVAAGGAAAVLRTSWVFSAHGSNFLKTMLRLSDTRDALSVVDDQIGGPTPAADIARACLSIARQLAGAPEKRGIYHFSGGPDVSWKGFAEAIFAAANRAVTVTGISSADYPALAARPLNSRLDCRETETVFGLPRPDWQRGVAAVLGQLGVP